MKVLNPTHQADMEREVAELVSFLEAWFPPRIFDIMVHLPLHLMEELFWCGPLHLRWCYLVEHHMRTLTNYVRDWSRPEASMANSYAIDKALGFCTEYFRLYPHSHIFTCIDTSVQFTAYGFKEVSIMQYQETSNTNMQASLTMSTTSIGFTQPTN